MISEFFQNYRNGIMDEMLGMELTKVISASQKHAKAGKLNIAISFKPKNAGETEVNVKFTKTLPTRDNLSSIMFVSPEGNLLSDDPRQTKLFDRVECLQDSETGEIVEPVKVINE